MWHLFAKPTSPVCVLCCLMRTPLRRLVNLFIGCLSAFYKCICATLRAEAGGWVLQLSSKISSDLLEMTVTATLLIEAGECFTFSFHCGSLIWEERAEGSLRSSLPCKLSLLYKIPSIEMFWLSVMFWNMIVWNSCLWADSVRLAFAADLLTFLDLGFNWQKGEKKECLQNAELGVAVALPLWCIGAFC